MKIQSQSHLSSSSALVWLAALIFLESCHDNGTEKSGKPQPFSVFEYFTASGWMGDGEDPARTWLNLDEGYTINAHSSPSSIKVSYRSGGPNGWAGIYWQNAPNNWCRSPGLNFSDSGFTRISFWARGEIGAELIEFKAGGIRECAAGGDYQDSFETRAYRITLDTTWTQYTIDLSGKNLHSVIGGFCCTVPASSTVGTKTFYIDDVYYE